MKDDRWTYKATMWDPRMASVIEADPGDDGQTPSGNRQVINGQEQQEEEKSGKF